ncbi:MAG: endolytic transglycosylase MltG [Desulfovibrio sp.]|jgi:UPF0755 protein|nr:endolytic transglycosylase MltG [Desulfovibrio sp.]
MAGGAVRFRPHGAKTRSARAPDKPFYKRNATGTQSGMARLISFFFWVLLLGGACLAYEAYRFLHTPGSDAARDVLITIAPGSRFDQVARDLKQAGVVSDVFRFRLLAYGKEATGAIKAGEYLINTGMLPEQVLWHITRGQSLLYRLFVREGLTWWETAREVEAQGFARYEDFRETVHDPVFLREHHIPFANAEGFLFPETYMRSKPRAINKEDKADKAQAREVASAMVKMFWAKTRPLWERLPSRHSAAHSPGAPARDARSAVLASPEECDPEALRRLLILASLVEKETSLPEERARVAGVYANRLRVNMLLQCDPTIIYGLGERFTGSILKSQLNDASNPYNTYRHGGLPPGPICSPGMDALKAAAMPERHDFFYFVAKGEGGGHNFNKTLTEHNRDVDAYRKEKGDGL